MTEMNKELLLKVADILEKEEFQSKFNMDSWIDLNGRLDQEEWEKAWRGTVSDAFKNHCGTTACIAGHIVYAAEPDTSMEEPVDIKARRLAGLNNKTAENLFMPESNYYYNVSAKGAAMVIRNLVETNEVDWSIVPKEEFKEEKDD